jgi:hypothetical protein
MKLLNDAADKLDAAISFIAGSQSTSNVSFVDPRSAFADDGGHGLCAAGTAWIHGLFPDALQRPDPLRWSFHPNIDGQAAYARLFTEKAT